MKSDVVSSPSSKLTSTSDGLGSPTNAPSVKSQDSEVKILSVTRDNQHDASHHVINEGHRKENNSSSEHSSVKNIRPSSFLISDILSEKSPNKIHVVSSYSSVSIPSILVHHPSFVSNPSLHLSSLQESEAVQGAGERRDKLEELTATKLKDAPAMVRSSFSPKGISTFSSPIESRLPAHPYHQHPAFSSLLGFNEHHISPLPKSSFFDFPRPLNEFPASIQPSNNPHWKSYLSNLEKKDDDIDVEIDEDEDEEDDATNSSNGQLC